MSLRGLPVPPITCPGTVLFNLPSHVALRYDSTRALGTGSERVRAQKLLLAPNSIRIGAQEEEEEEGEEEEEEEV